MNEYNKVLKYLKETKIFNKNLIISGWFDINDALCFYIISCLQKLNNINGNATEIGVHHGKSSIFLSNLYFDKVFCNDIFESYQQENVSNSGNGSLNLFKKLLEEYGTPKKVNIIIKNSLNLTTEDVNDNIFFHIDGGHSYNEVMSDLNIAKLTSKDIGVIVLDDAFSYTYPDVCMAISRFLQENEDYVPFLITSAKLYLCNKKYYSFYYTTFSKDENINLFGLNANRGHAKTCLNNKVTMLSRENLKFKDKCDLINLVVE